jgi:hypothetical protein
LHFTGFTFAKAYPGESLLAQVALVDAVLDPAEAVYGKDPSKPLVLCEKVGAGDGALLPSMRCGLQVNRTQ